MIEFLAPILIFLVTLPLALRRLNSLTRWERRLITLSYFGHMLAVYAVIGVTKYYYRSGDMLGFHEEGRRIATLLSRDLGVGLPRVMSLLFQRGGEELVTYGAGNATGSMHAISGLLAFVFGGSLAASCAIVAVLAFSAKLGIYRVLRSELNARYHHAVLYATLLVPSVVFWSSGLLKEALAMFFLGLMVTGGHRLLGKRGRVTALIALAVGVVGCGLIKGYILVPFAIAAISMVYVRRTQNSGLNIFTTPARLGVAVLVGFGFLVALGAVFPRYDFRQLQEQISREQSIGQTIEGGSNISLDSGSSDSVSSLIISSPMAVVTALLRPALIEARNPLAFINGLETLIFTILLLRLFRRSGLKASIERIRNSSLLTFCAVFTLVFALGVGFATTNLGTLSRYRMPLVPFFVVVLVVVGDKKWSNKNLSRRSDRSVVSHV